MSNRIPSWTLLGVLALAVPTLATATGDETAASAVEAARGDEAVTADDSASGPDGEAAAAPGAGARATFQSHVSRCLTVVYCNTTYRVCCCVDFCIHPFSVIVIIVIASASSRRIFAPSA